MTPRHVALVCALALAAGFPRAAEAGKKKKKQKDGGETTVFVDLLSAPTGAPAAHQAAVVETEGEVGRATPAVVSIGPKTSLTIRTAEALGPSYRVLSISLATGFGRLGTISEFETKPKLRKKLQVGLVANVDQRVDRVKVHVVLRGVGSGDFAWLNDYEYTLTQSCPVDLTRGPTGLDVRVVRDAGPFADFGEGLAVECRPPDGP